MFKMVIQDSKVLVIVLNNAQIMLVKRSTNKVAHSLARAMYFLSNFHE